MAIVNYKEMIEDMVGGIPSEISDYGESIFNRGIAVTIERFAATKPEMLHLFASEVSFVPSEGYTLENLKLINVTANNGTDDIVCRYVSDKLKQKVQKGSNSIHEATLNSPVYYVINGKVYTAPQEDFSVKIESSESISVAFNSGALYKANNNELPAVGDVFKVEDSADFSGGELLAAKGSAISAGDYFRVTNNGLGTEAVEYIDKSKCSLVVVGTVSNYATGTSSISNFPKDNYYRLPLLYTAYNIIAYKLANISYPTPDFSGITEPTPPENTSSFTNFDSLLSAEDTELAVTELEKQRELLGDYQADVQVYQVAMQKYHEDIAKVINDTIEKIEKIKAESVNLINLYKAYKAEFDSAFVTFQQEA